MRARGLLLAGLLLPLIGPLLAAGCGEPSPIPNADLSLRIAVGAESVAPGRAFPVTVTRIWDKGLVPAAFDDHALAPIALRLESTSRREDARHVEETLRYRGYAFALADVSVRPPVLTAKPVDGGPARKTTGDPVHLRVVPEVDPEKPGDPEPPGDPPPEPSSRTPWIVGAGVLLSALAALVLRARRRRAPDVPLVDRGAPRPDPAARALDRLRASPASAEEIAAILREYLAAGFSLPALERTTEEILAEGTARGVLVPAARSALLDVLSSCDRVKFARHVPTAGALEEMIGRSEGLVRQMADRGLPIGGVVP